jgi:transposase InsO family protein
MNPGFLHVDIKYLPKMPDETSHRYLFVAIDRATRWVFFKIYANQTLESSLDFLKILHEACPVCIKTVLTDNGTQFTDRFLRDDRKASGTHPFDQACARNKIGHRLIPPRHPQTNGIVERRNGRIQEVLQQTRFASANELETTLTDKTARNSRIVSSERTRKPAASIPSTKHAPGARSGAT